MADVWAADAATNPDPTALAESGCLFIARYVGTAYQRYGVDRTYIDACLANGVGVGLIMQEWASQFLGGYAAAIACGQRMLAGWDRLGAPRDGSVIPMVVMVDPNPGAVPGNEGALRDFARGWHDLLTREGFPEWTGYGSRYGLDVAQSAAPSMTRRWGVGTWGFGERGDGSLPADVPADMIQHGNRGAPVPRTDYNTLFRLDMGQWGGPAVKPPERKVNDMPYIAVGNTPFMRAAAYVDGGFRVGPIFGGPPGPAEYGAIPQEALDWKSKPGRDAVQFVFFDDDPERFVALLAERPTPGEGGGGDGTGLTAEQRAAVKTAEASLRSIATNAAESAKAATTAADALGNAFD